MIKYRHEFGEKIMNFTIKHKETKIKFGEKKYPPKIEFGEKRTAITINGLKKIKDIPAFHQGTHIPINSREDLKEIIELPCLKACQELYDKNIETIDSGCNGENCPNCAYIVVNYDTLDEHNKHMADEMVKNKIVKFHPKSDVSIRNYFNHIFIQVPTSPEETVASVEKKLSKITQFFAPQQKIVKKIDPQEILAMHRRSIEGR